MNKVHYCINIALLITLLQPALSLPTATQDGIQELPNRLHDCSDERLAALDRILCVDMNNKLQGHRSHFAVRLFLPQNDKLEEKTTANHIREEASLSRAGNNSSKNIKDEDVKFDAPTEHHRERRVTAHWLPWPKSSDGYVYIPYEFDYFANIQNITGAFTAAIQDFNLLSCIRLIPRQNNHTDYIYVISGSGCYTYLGRRGGSQTLSLQSYTQCATKGVAIHEILHVLGFYHEMSRRDRDEHIRIDFSNIPYEWQRQFETHIAGNGSVWGMPYDTQSIMHYGNYAAAIYPYRPTITSLRDPNEILGQRDGMSTKDRMQVNRMYECEDFITRL